MPLFEFICKELDQFAALDLKADSHARDATGTSLWIRRSPQTPMRLICEIKAQCFDKCRLANIVRSDNNVEFGCERDLAAREEALVVAGFKRPDVHGTPPTPRESPAVVSLRYDVQA